MRCIYMYDADAKQILESHDVTSKSPVERELIRIEMLLRCEYPCEVFDSMEYGTPYGVNRRWLIAETFAAH